MLGQLQMTTDGELLDKVEMAIRRIKTFEPPDGYYVAFSGGKDSQCVYHLCQMAGVKFDAHYSVTSVDPPELVRFIKEHYPDVRFERQHDKKGKPVTMWSLIPQKRLPPTRTVRYCCEKLKESNGKDRFTITGVRWEESSNRKLNQGVITIPCAGKKKRKMLEDAGINFQKTKRGGVVLNYDNDPDRRITEYCMRTGKAIENPIIDWTEEDVWEFLNANNIPHCCLYDEGFSRLGCIGCPMGRAGNQRKEFDRWPAYEKLYKRSFEKMLVARKEAGLETYWKTADDVMDWWIGEEENSAEIPPDEYANKYEKRKDDP